ncbi:MULTISPECIES: NAD(P)/FAD-dependent oxidoreductase [Sphingomonas]|uniref:NAD(P)/FAD-dependent oxidoreductase n=1 Tax=Sphingomonas TaxID=13687 RepID=UPI0020BF4B7F|nr:FAD-dependent oxidoreductase [Sphingomonas faeni]MCK8455888.1 FAD-dependent oxidoreductase [Sphingomonas faeni]
MRIAIVGAGIAGLSCAVRLQDAGHDVTLFDKGRGAGGRMSTRRVETSAGDAAFDHGAQYLTARDPAFVEAIDEWRVAGVVARWPAAGDDAWVGTPGMNAIVKHLADHADVHWQHRVTAIRSDDSGWHVDLSVDDAPQTGGSSKTGTASTDVSTTTPVTTASFDAVVIAVPAEQAAPLLADHDPAMAAQAEACHSSPNWTAMLGFAERLAIPDDVIRHAGIIGWAARNTAKPGRSGPEAWVVQATPEWSTTHLEDTADSVVDRLLAALADYVEGPMPEPIVRTGHRWRYARATPAASATPAAGTSADDHGALWNAEARLGVAGDWLLAPRIESAWLSGRMLADRILAG